jgi:hypothetical protein
MAAHKEQITQGAKVALGEASILQQARWLEQA